MTMGSVTFVFVCFFDYFMYAVSYHQVTVNFTPLLTVSSATRTLLQVRKGRRSPVGSTSLARRQIA